MQCIKNRSKQIATASKQLLFNDILGAAWHKLGGTLLLIVGQLFAEPGHGAIEVVQLQCVGTVDAVILFPALGRAIAAATVEAMQDGEKHRPFDGKLKSARPLELGQNWGAVGLLPEALEDQGGANAACGDGGHLAAAVCGEEQDMLGETRPGSERPIQVAGGLEVVESPQGNENGLADAALVAGVFDDLELRSGSGLLDAEELGDLRRKDTTILPRSVRSIMGKSQQIPHDVALQT